MEVDKIAACLPQSWYRGRMLGHRYASKGKDEGLGLACDSKRLKQGSRAGVKIRGPG